MAAVREAAGMSVVPSFSIILETENLQTAHEQRLFQALESLANQMIPPRRAREIVVPSAIRRSYPG